MLKVYPNGLTVSDMNIMYINGKSIKEIAEVFGISTDTVRNNFKKYGIQMKHANTFKVNDNFFKLWSYKMAYILGMFITDGCLYADKPVLEFAQKDKLILEKMRDVMKSEANIKLGKAGVYKLTITSPMMYIDLLQLGLTPRKSFTKEMPCIPPKFMPSFIRGVIDGDGHVQKDGYTVTITTASESFAKSLEQVFKGWELNSFIKTEVSKSGSNIYRILVSGKDDVMKLHDIIYSDGTNLYLVRKKSRMAHQKYK